MNKILIAMCAVLALSACEVITTEVVENGPDVIRVYHDEGGYLNNYIPWIDEIEKSNKRVEIRGSCYSGCTFLLSLDNLCISDNAVFGYHGPNHHGIIPVGDDPQYDWVVPLMTSYYEKYPEIKERFLKVGQYRALNLDTMSAQETRAITGHPKC